MRDEPQQSEFKLGVFSTGDLIALAGFIFAAGALWVQVEMQSRSNDRQDQAIAALQEAMAGDYVRRADYREDLREIKDLLRQIDAKVDRKVDKQ